MSISVTIIHFVTQFSLRIKATSTTTTMRVSKKYVKKCLNFLLPLFFQCIIWNLISLVDTSLCWPKGASGGRLKVSGRQIKKQTNKQKQKLRKPFWGKIYHFFIDRHKRDHSRRELQTSCVLLYSSNSTLDLRDNCTWQSKNTTLP